jgi:hypothetical protein
MAIYPWNKSGISHVKYHFFFSPELLLHNYKCGGCIPCGVTVNTHTIVNWKNSAKCYRSISTIFHLSSKILHQLLLELCLCSNARNKIFWKTFQKEIQIVSFWYASAEMISKCTRNFRMKAQLLFIAKSAIFHIYHFKNNCEFRCTFKMFRKWIEMISKMHCAFIRKFLVHLEIISAEAYQKLTICISQYSFTCSKVHYSYFIIFPT